MTTQTATQRHDEALARYKAAKAAADNMDQTPAEYEAAMAELEAAGKALMEAKRA